MGGYAGKVLKVNLDSGDVSVEPLDESLKQDFLGGGGIGAKLLFDLLKQSGGWDVDPLSPQNPLIFMTGPVTGMMIPGAARWTITARSPQTGCFGESNVGGYFGAELKMAGYDGIVITGASEKPVYLYIVDDTVEIRDASELWGKDVYETDDALIAACRGDAKKSGTALTIGPAGEKMVKFASVINKKGHVAGRIGIGAVFGSKKLKGIYVRGSGKIQVADPEAFKTLRGELKEICDESITIESLRSFGTASHMDVGIIGGDVPMKNWSLTEWDGFDEINPVAYGEKVLVGNATCYGCLVSCKREVEVAEGPYQMKKGPGPEYETVATFGTMCLNSNMESIAKANEICNTLGMDTITCGSTIAWAIECFENGLLDESKTDGLKLNWGNHEAIIELARKIGMKEGFGELLSEGSAKASETIGGKQFLTTVRGLEAPMHDPRGAHGYGLAYATSTRGACHMDSLQYPVEGGAMLLDDIPELADQLEEMTSEGKALIVTKTQDFGQFFSHALVMCNLAGLAMNATFALRALNCAVGTNLSIDDALKIGQRIYYLKRGLNNLFGSGVEDDMLPERMMTAIEGGPTDGSVPDMKLMLEEYYALRKFNGKGWPEREKLEELGLSELAQELYKE